MTGERHGRKSRKNGQRSTDSMRYCADTWFILAVQNEDGQSVQLLKEIKTGKGQLIIPIVVFAEATKKLLQKGVAEIDISLFWEGVERSDKVILVEAGRSIAEEAAKVSLSYGLSLMDSFVAATHKLHESDILLSADTDYNPLVKKKYLKVQSW